MNPIKSEFYVLDIVIIYYGSSFKELAIPFLIRSPGGLSWTQEIFIIEPLIGLEGQIFWPETGGKMD